MTYYDILNVPEDVTLKEIKQSYHKLSRKYHITNTMSVYKDLIDYASQ